MSDLPAFPNIDLRTDVQTNAASTCNNGQTPEQMRDFLKAEFAPVLTDSLMQMVKEGADNKLRYVADHHDLHLTGINRKALLVADIKALQAEFARLEALAKEKEDTKAALIIEHDTKVAELEAIRAQIAEIRAKCAATCREWDEKAIAAVQAAFTDEKKAQLAADEQRLLEAEGKMKTERAKGASLDEQIADLQRRIRALKKKLLRFKPGYKFDSAKLLEIKVMSATGLKDGLDTPDSFVRGTLGLDAFTTAVASDSTTPTWNEGFWFRVESREDQCIEFVVKDRDCPLGFNPADIIGCGTLDIGEQGAGVYDGKEFDGEVALTGADGSAAGTLNVQCRMYDDKMKSPHGKLDITVVEAKGLKAADVTTGTSDPFAEIHLGSTCKKTNVVKQTLEPSWGDGFSWKASRNLIGSLDYSSGQVLCVEVKDQDGFSGADSIGYCTLDLKYLWDNEEKDVWMTLRDDSGLMVSGGSADLFSESSMGAIHLKLTWVV